MNILESLFPGWAFARESKLLRLDQIKAVRSGYEGGALGRRTQNWKTSSRDANAEIAPSLTMLRNRSRDLRRNNPYATSAIESIIDNTVGYGIKPKFKGRNKTITKRAADMWALHCEKPSIDYDGVHDIYGLEALSLGTIAESGAVLVRRRLLSTSQMRTKGLALPFQVQILEPDYIDTTHDGEQKDGSVDIRGIRFEPSGGVRGYWLYPNHPGSAGMHMKAVSEFVPARDILHIFRVDRPGQVHGVPWAAPVLLRLRNYDEVEDAYVEREKIAACFSVFFTGLDPDTSAKKAQIAERLEPGLIDFAPAGTGVEFANPPGVNGYKDFNWVTLHAVASGFGVPYEELVGDLAGVNFSSGRMGYQRYGRRIDRWQWQMFIPGFCNGIGSWFNSSCQFAGVLSEDCAMTWVPPRRIMVNPKEEIAAKKEEIRNGLTTWSQAVTELGYDSTEQAEAIAADNALLDQHDLKLDCDPRFALPAGSAGATDNGESGGDKPVKKTKSDEDDAE